MKDRVFKDDLQRRCNGFVLGLDGFIGPPGRAEEREMIEFWLAERGMSVPVVKVPGE